MKLYVITPYEGRTDEEILEYREEIAEAVAEVSDEEVELALPTRGVGRVASEIDAVLSSDLVFRDSKAKYSLPCRLVDQVALCYNVPFVDDGWLDMRRVAKAEQDAMLAEQAAIAEQFEDDESQEPPETSYEGGEGDEGLSA